jgi:hypothetical protein
VSLADARETGEAVEAVVADAVDPLRRVPDDAAEWHDAVATAVISPSAALELRLGSVAVISRGTPVEVKAARVSTSNGGNRETAGRWHFRRRQHEQLLDRGGAYALTVYDDDDTDLELVSCLLVPSTVLDDVVDSDSWCDLGDRVTAKLSWTRLLDPTRRGSV